MSTAYNEYLAHYGVKGMRWGVRRYQNENGSLIRPLGRRQKAESATWKSKDVRHLSDDELKRRNNRLQLENQYRSNVENSHPVKKEIKQIAKKVLLYSAVGAVSGVMATKYKAGANFVADYMTTPLRSIKG